MEVRDPIHGAIELSPSETVILDDPWVQRLRSIRQMGFSQMAFPGAVHTRYVHSLGVMYLAGQAFDAALEGAAFSSEDVRARLRSAVRIAALCHDLGHPPFSHCMEFAMPPVADLQLGWLDPGDRVATHEDYTIAILEHTSLGRLIQEHFDFTARHVASLVCPEISPGDDFFLDGGLDHRRVLSQIVSSELDVDRLDYLPRDAVYSGARYGQVDVGWLIRNLTTWIDDGHVNLALEGRAVYAFDHFLLARHHMFLMIYFHHKSVIYEEMLRRSVGATAYALPSDLDAYLLADDVGLQADLRRSGEPWARRIVEHRPFHRVFERHGNPQSVDLETMTTRLDESGIPSIAAASTGRLSRYAQYGAKRREAHPIYVLERTKGMPVERVRPLAQVSEVFERYADERVIGRIYVDPDHLDKARAVIDAS
ncbi:MAG: HD domain-containing protein [Myxococcota bacterium]